MQTCTCEECVLRREEMTVMSCSFGDTKRFDCLVDETEEQDKCEDSSFFNSLWLIGAGLVAQGGESLPYCMSSRFLLFTWWFFMLLVITIYTSALTAFLTVSNLGVPFESVLGLLGQEEYEWGILESAHPETLLLTHRDPRYSELVHKGQAMPDFYSSLDRLREGKFVFIDEAPILKHHLHADCNVFSVGVEFQSFEYAFGLRKDSPYTDLIDAYILKYREEGFIDSLWEKWSSDNLGCSNKLASNTVMGLQKLSGMFYILFIGVGISFILVIFELCHASVRDVRKGHETSISEAFVKRLSLKKNHILNQGRDKHLTGPAVKL